MTLRRKTLLLIAVTMAGLLAVLFGVVSHIWLGSVAQLEHERTRTDVARLREALAEDVRSLERTAVDWSAWDDAYRFVEDGNEEFVRSNLGVASLSAIGVSSIAFVREPGRTTFACSVDVVGGTTGPFPPEVAEWIARDDSTVATARGRSGFLRTGAGLVLVAARPVLTSRRAGPPRGALVLCRAIDAATIRRLAERTRLDASVFPASAGAIPSDAGPALESLLTREPELVRPLDEDRIAGYALLADVTGQPGVLLRVVEQREIHAEGRRALALLLATLLVTGTAFGTLTVFLIERQVLSRLHRLGEEVRRVGSSGDLSLRATVTGRDELGEIAASVNSMLTALEQAHRRRLESEGALRASEDALRHSYKMEAIGQLAGGVAHDFNNLLTVVLGYSEILLQREGTDPAAREQLEAIRRAATRAADLTQKLLAFGRRQAVQPRVVHLDRFVEETADMLRRLVGAQVEVCLTSKPPVEPVSADPSQLTQMLLNLASNARDALPSGGRVTIDVSTVVLARAENGVAAGRWVRLSFSDDGVGMDEKTAQRIFEPFFTTKEVGRGSGLGLPSVHGIVHQAGGRISVASAPGRGTTIVIHLPPTAAPATGDSTGELRPARSHGAETVLLVEDDAPVRDVARAALANHGYSVLVAATPHEALQIAGESEFDCLATDVLMPRMKGPELARRIRAHRPWVRVLFLSGYPDDAEVRDAIASGAAFVAKPFTQEELAHAVRRVLDAPVPPAPAALPASVGDPVGTAAAAPR